MENPAGLPVVYRTGHRSTLSRGLTAFSEVDITDWRAGPIEQLGTKPKHWCEDPHGDLWLFKQTTRHRRAYGAGGG